ncbi:hypothetical protein BU14_0191s0012 [Porphyra umbilicalis]|uniref:Uncharacterized protein n=1 Tax=Porphyra umbilicalis TaxID=2786 RepID=A0A1X6P6B4_PORUM|nr:hypothetical protein BU14_0191s0012 [Porphyra umbilicalis]|eukprot:OSX76432.1 hypothetical protein BU14_0191s0012 [Porphyra umbilicalis]
MFYCIRGLTLSMLRKGKGKQRHDPLIARVHSPRQAARAEKRCQSAKNATHRGSKRREGRQKRQGRRDRERKKGEVGGPPRRRGGRAGRARAPGAAATHAFKGPATPPGQPPPPPQAPPPPASSAAAGGRAKAPPPPVAHSVGPLRLGRRANAARKGGPTHTRPLHHPPAGAPRRRGTRPA